MSPPTGEPPTHPQKLTIMERRGMQRPSLNRNLSSFSQAIASVTSTENINLNDIPTTDSLTSAARVQIKEDIHLVQTVQNERLPSSATTTPTPTGFITPSDTVNRYSHWPCAFSIIHPVLTPSAVPRSKPEFLSAVTTELTTIKHLKAGLRKYVATINSEEHTVFSSAFLESQNKSTEVTVGQLGEVEGHLREVMEELEGMGDGDGNGDVRAELVEVYSHAKPWVARVRKIVLDTHVFYKTNYALASGKRAGKGQKASMEP